MYTIGLILLVFAFVIMCISTRVPAIGGWPLLNIALAFWIAAEIFGGVGRVFFR